MKMVSTRGHKYKFTDGERVLCYEPDPTKAKVLYDSKLHHYWREFITYKVPVYKDYADAWTELVKCHYPSCMIESKLTTGIQDADIFLGYRATVTLPHYNPHVLGVSLCGCIPEYPSSRLPCEGLLISLGSFADSLLEIHGVIQVLEVIVGKDERGRKNVEYLIHFQGWNSSWDRCVSEDYVLKDTEENRKLQKDLADKAQLQLGAYLYRRDRKKRTRTLSQKINEAWDSGTNSCSSKKSQVDEGEERFELATSTEDDEDEEDVENDDDDNNNASSMDAEDMLDERIPLDLSSHMKTLLEEDYNLINNENKVVILPASPTALEILEGYIRHCGVKSPRESDEKCRRRTRGHFQKSRDIDPIKEYEAMVARLNLCKEIVDGLRIYFDFALGQLLLYDLERPQYDETRAGVKDFKREMRVPEIKTEPCDSTSEDDTSQNVSQSSADAIPDIRIESETIETERKRSLRSHKEPTPAVEPSCSISQNATNSNNGIGKLTIKNLGSLGQNNTNASKNNHCSTMSTSSTSSYYSPLIGKISPRASVGTINAKIAKLMDHASSWKIVPQSYLQEKPPYPSTLYGAVHLARLFVKLPSLLYIANQPEKENQPRVLPERKLKALIHHLQMFLTYLEGKPEWFGEKHYMENPYKKHEQLSPH